MIHDQGRQGQERGDILAGGATINTLLDEQKYLLRRILHGHAATLQGVEQLGKILAASVTGEQARALRKTLAVLREDVSGTQYDLTRAFDLNGKAAVLYKLATESQEGVVAFAESPSDNGTVTVEVDISDTLPPPPRPKPGKK